MRNGEGFYLEVESDCMKEARILKGDSVYVHKQDEYKVGDVVAIQEGDNTTIRRVLVQEDISSGHTRIIGKVLHVKFKV